MLFLRSCPWKLDQGGMKMARIPVDKHLVWSVSDCEFEIVWWSASDCVTNVVSVSPSAGCLLRSDDSSYPLLASTGISPSPRSPSTDCPPVTSAHTCFLLAANLPVAQSPWWRLLVLGPCAHTSEDTDVPAQPQLSKSNRRSNVHTTSPECVQPKWRDKACVCSQFGRRLRPDVLLP